MMTSGKFQPHALSALPPGLGADQGPCILIADDHDLLREVLAAYIEDLWPRTRVLQAGRMDEALRILTPNGHRLPDIVVLDLEMPGMDNFEGLDNLLRRSDEIPVVILSDEADRQQIIESFRRGASGFIPKTMKPAAMISALQLILAGEKFFPSSVIEILAPAAPGSSAAADGEGSLDPGVLASLEKLTQREHSVLCLLAEGASNKEIARDLTIQEITVKSHMKSIFRKLNTRNRTQAAKIALEAGLAVNQDRQPSGACSELRAS